MYNISGLQLHQNGVGCGAWRFLAGRELRERGFGLQGARLLGLRGLFRVHAIPRRGPRVQGRRGLLLLEAHALLRELVAALARRRQA